MCRQRKTVTSARSGNQKLSVSEILTGWEPGPESIAAR